MKKIYLTLLTFHILSYISNSQNTEVVNSTEKKTLEFYPLVPNYFNDTTFNNTTQGGLIKGIIQWEKFFLDGTNSILYGYGQLHNYIFNATKTYVLPFLLFPSNFLLNRKSKNSTKFQVNRYYEDINNINITKNHANQTHLLNPNIPIKKYKVTNIPLNYISRNCTNSKPHLRGNNSTYINLLQEPLFVNNFNLTQSVYNISESNLKNERSLQFIMPPDSLFPDITDSNMMSEWGSNQYWFLQNQDPCMQIIQNQNQNQNDISQVNSDSQYTSSNLFGIFS
ncbi:uncharacterized protein CMU_026700 [Cryptosporidium muris RN66]|uniref:Uncharacterized protein n=1 Tax=Cryptosporidium muris (strain RN66) TaxID=441375 RepID=B6ABB0_CRYMR|nr:uncharacterized protein CMU_026700 [Cryptosporidium muris RN66]EEA05662.1 hypothetical protein CMU_026700 [Cryptosporidium muris RN66]|eukprot:XP_002140011.1 hypothetical protein [Cryptosporidium muris RN66]